jgi:hypothetical protein
LDKTATLEVSETILTAGGFIEIIGTEAIARFASSLILTIFMMATTLVATVYK